MENKKGDWWFPSKGGTITVEPAVATGYRTVGIRPRSPPFPPPARPIVKTEVTLVNDTFSISSTSPVMIELSEEEDLKAAAQVHGVVS